MVRENPTAHRVGITHTPGENLVTPFYISKGSHCAKTHLKGPTALVCWFIFLSWPPSGFHLTNCHLQLSFGHAGFCCLGFLFVCLFLAAQTFASSAAYGAAGIHLLGSSTEVSME